MTAPGGVLLDTNAVAAVMKSTDEGQHCRSLVEGRLLAVSFITVGELLYGAEKANWGPDRRATLEEALRRFVVIPYDHQVAVAFARVRCGARVRRQPIPYPDLWIAACAVRHGLPIITDDITRFSRVEGLVVLPLRGLGAAIP